MTEFENWKSHRDKRIGILELLVREILVLEYYVELIRMQFYRRNIVDTVLENIALRRRG